MDTENTTDTYVLEYTNPTTKEQLVSAGIQVAAALAAPVLLAVGYAGVLTVASYIERRKEKKAAKIAATIETPNEEN